MKISIAKDFEDIAQATESNETKEMITSIIRLSGALIGALASIMTIYYGLALLINSMPLIGSIIGAAGVLMFNLIFYTFYPEKYLERGKTIMIYEEAITEPAESIYETDRNVAGVYSFSFTSVLLTFGSVWSANIQASATKAYALSYALSLISLFGLVGILSMENSTVEKGILGTAMLAIASYGLYLTTTTGLASLTSPELEVGGFLARLIFFGIFEIMAGFLFLSTLGYVDYVVTGE